MQNYFHQKSLSLGKKERTRSILVDSVIAMVSEKKLKQASIKTITQEAGLAIGTFYNHFDSREALILEAAAQVAKEITDEIAIAVEKYDDHLDRIIISTDMMINRAAQTPEWGYLITEYWLHIGKSGVDISENLRRDLNNAKKSGHFSTDITPLLEAQIVSLVALAISLQITNGEDRKIREQTCIAILTLIGVKKSVTEKKVTKLIQ